MALTVRFSSHRPDSVANPAHLRQTIAMASPTGLFAAHDSGAPADSTDYTTVVLVHGYGWHSGESGPTDSFCPPP